MNTMRWCTIALLAAALTGCPSNNGNNSDGGGGGNGGGGGVSDGGDGGSGGGGGGGGGQATIPFADVCSNVTEGFKEYEYASAYGFCGVPVTRADLEHLFYEADFGITWNDAFAGSNCAVTDGGLATQIARYSEAISAGRLEYNAQKAFECRQNGRTWKDGGYSADLSFEACSEVFVGKVAQGGICKAGYECSEGTYCKPTNESTCEGTCVARVAANQPCSPIRDVCVADHACNDDGTGYKCFPLANEGDACAESANCKSGLICFDDGSSSFCQKLVALGGACELDANGEGNCAEGNCITSGGATVGVCTAPAVLGQACGTTPAEGLPLCDTCSECVAATGGTGNTCQATRRTGADCAEDADCFDPQVWACVDSKCQVKPRTGEACVVDGNGAQGSCMYYDNFCKASSDGATDGICTALPKLGEACGDAFDKSPNCAEGYCNGTTLVCTAFSAEGETCTTSEDPNGKSPVCSGSNLFCDTRFSTGGDGVDGTCRTLLGLDEECDADLAPCADTLFCDINTSVCAEKLALGAPCSASSDCQSNFCDEGGLCANLKALGEVCVDDDECQSGTCDPSSQKCVTPCGIEPNEAEGCMSYDLGSFSTYLFFAAVLAPFMSRRSRKQS